jgi:hypothetical protein
VASKFEKHQVSRLPYQPYSLNISPWDFWLFGIGMLMGVLKDHESNSSDEIEEALTKFWHELTFNEMRSVFYNWVRGLTWVTKNGEEYIIE